MKISLLVIDGVHAGETIEVEGLYLLVGRGQQCHVRPNSQDVSLRHCAILARDGVYHLRDMESQTGTFLNDRRLRGEIEMRDGDLLRVGPLTFLLQLGAVGHASDPGPVPIATDGPPEEQPLSEENSDYIPANEMMSSPADTTEMPTLAPYDVPLEEHSHANGNGHAHTYADDYQYGLQASATSVPMPPTPVPPQAVTARPLPVVQGRRIPPAPQQPPAPPVNGNGAPNGVRPNVTRVTRVTMNGMVRRPPT